MNKNKTQRALTVMLTLAILLSLFSTNVAAANSPYAPSADVTFTILHHNDFHGQLEPSGSNPGLARLANYVNTIRTAQGDANVLLFDAGDEMQGSLLSNIQQGAPVIDVYNTMSYDAATFGNHEFDWGQDVLTARTGEALYPYLTANITKMDGADCASSGWDAPDFADAPYQIFTVGAPVSVKVAVIAVTTQETPTITVASATAGLCFRDAAESILHYYDEMKTAGADVIVVLSHLGYTDGGYGYGLNVYGDQTLATKLNTAGKPVDLIIGGHSHTDLASATTVGATKVVQAHYNGRKLGRADITVTTAGVVTVNWTRITVGTGDPQDPTVDAMIDAYVADPDYQALINDPIGYVQTDLLRNYNGDSMMGDFIDDAIYGQLNGDLDETNDVDMFFNNAGGIRIDWCEKEDPANPGTYIWSSTAADCNTGVWAHPAMVLNYGQMFQILPFGNQTIVGDMTGAQILELLHQSATLFKGAIQPSGIRYSFFRYSDALPGPQPYGWGAYDVEVFDKTASEWVALDLEKTYRVGTNEFLAPAGQDGYVPFKYMTNITYWGDMLDAVNAYVEANYNVDHPYRGPNNDGLLDGRVTRNGDGDDIYESGEIVPLTILHHNDSHGNLDQGAYVGYTQLATLIKQERLHNPDRTLLLSSGDNIQGDAMMYYFKTAPTGFTSNGTPIADPALHINPLIKAFNAMDYDAMVLGNHEFNFGSDVFTSVLGQATFPILQANITDTGEYGLAEVGVLPYTQRTVGGDIQVAILGIGNHRIPNYELPSNIPGLTFTDPIASAQTYAAALAPTNDVVIALTHIGFTENPNSVEVDDKVDTNLAASTTNIDAVIGGHSHTNPASGFGAYKYLPTIVADADGNPVVINHAYRYNNTLGEVVMGLRVNAPLALNNYEVVSQTGRYISVSSSTAEDATIDAIVDPYTVLLAAYRATPIGATTAPIDTTTAFTEETNGANLQADASVAELESHGIDVDFHLSGAMTNKLIATTATPGTPYNLTIDDMFAAMPYENSLVVLEMNGPQLKAVLERAYRNYFYYKYYPDWGGYSHYTTCMIDTNAGNQITYNELYPELPNGNNVVSLNIGGHLIDFTDAETFYNVSTVNYLAAGSCNFNDAGVTLWPLDQIVADTQYYVRDAVINYVTDMVTVSPAIEGRLQFLPTTFGNDVPTTNWAWTFIEKLAAAGVTGGCGTGTFCPDAYTTRAQMAVFLLRAKYGNTYAPPAATGLVFNDVAVDDFAADYIEALEAEGVTTGCGGGNFCPNSNVTRAEMAVFLLRTMYGDTYTPPAALGTVFTDVPADAFAAAYIEALEAEGITSGCGGGNFCPTDLVTRAQMAVFLVTAFDLP